MMSVNEDQTLTGGIGYSPGNDRTLTGGVAGRIKGDETLTGGIGGHRQGDETLTGGIGGHHQDDKTLTGGKGGPDGFTRTRKAGETADMPPVKADWKAGDVIDSRYEVKELIGRGGMGTVFRVRHREWHIDMAVKMPLAHLVADEASRARFVREAQTWVDLGMHPNIVQCWYVRELDGMPRLFMDYLKGGSLKDRIRKGEVSPGEREKIIDLTIQACDGLGYAHEKGVVHRDVKPANMLMTRNDRLCLTDFGLVKIAGMEDIEGGLTHTGSDGDEHSLTLEGSALGTPQYGAPEQWRGEKNIDGRADIYALGVTLFELFCTRRPFDDGSHSEPPHVLIGRHLSSPPPDPREFNKTIKEPLAKLILRCLAKTPAERPASMAEIREELTGIYKEITGERYKRPVPAAGELRADSLNNKAVSLWDLGRREGASDLFVKAIQNDPQHFEATRNISILNWNEAKITDESLLERLRVLEDIHRGRMNYWRGLGEIHICRGAMDEASAVLKKAQAFDPIDEKIGNLIREANQAMSEDAGWARLMRTLKGHAGFVNAVAMSPDGKLGLSGSMDHTLILWDLTTGKRIRSFREQDASLSGHTDNVTSVAITPDGKSAISGSADETLRLWELKTGKCLQVFEGYTDIVTSATITPNGKFALSGSLDKNLWLWNLTTGKFLRYFEGHTDSVYAVAITPNGKFAISGSWDKTLRLWSLKTGKCLRIFEGHIDTVESVAVSPDGKLALSGSADETLRLWELKSGRCLCVFQGHTDSVESVAISPNGKFALSGSWDKTVRLWEMKTGKCLRTFEGHTDAVTSAVISADGKHALSGSLDYTLRLWNICVPSQVPALELTKIKELKVLKKEEKKARLLAYKAEQCLEKGRVSEALEVLCQARGIPGFERDSELLAIWSRAAEKAVRSALRTAWYLRTFEGHIDPVASVAISRDGRIGFSASREDILMWEMSTGKCLGSFAGHIDVVNAFAVSPDGKLGLSGSRDSTLRLWDLSLGMCIRTFEGHTDSVNTVAIGSDGDFGLSGGDDCTLRFWSLKTGSCTRVFKGHTDAVNAVAITPDRRFALSGSSDDTLRLWTLSSGECIRTFEGHTDSVNAVAITPDGKFGLSGSSDRSLQLWDMFDKKEKKPLSLAGDMGSVNAVAITPDGRFGFSGNDRAMLLWDLATEEGVCIFEGHSDTVTSLALSPDARFILSGSSDRTLQLWELDWEILPECMLTEEKKAEKRIPESDNLINSSSNIVFEFFSYTLEKLFIVISNHKPFFIVLGVLIALYLLNFILTYMAAGVVR
ncbi:protein kinase [Desulfobacterales bacterium HSG2]|nr:protein kinase [Desulfobacterales bacterium HSG2]